MGRLSALDPLEPFDAKTMFEAPFDAHVELDHIIDLLEEDEDEEEEEDA